MYIYIYIWSKMPRKWIGGGCPMAGWGEQKPTNRSGRSMHVYLARFTNHDPIWGLLYIYICMCMYIYICIYIYIYGIIQLQHTITRIRVTRKQQIKQKLSACNWGTTWQCLPWSIPNVSPINPQSLHVPLRNGAENKGPYTINWVITWLLLPTKCELQPSTIKTAKRR